jgi:Spy/CpxP family protein refolding chaperone
MKKTFIVIAVLIVSAVVVVSAYAVQPDKKPGSHKEFCFKNHLGLSDEQLAKMKELKISFHNDTRDLRYNLAIKRLEMRKLFTDPKTDDATLVAKQKEISNLRQQLSDKKAEKKLKWRKILTAEQIAKLDRMPHRHQAKRWAHHHHHESQYPAKG